MIGVFDSGIGGLSVLRAIRTRSPQADIVYFGDTKNAPYGNKSEEEVKKLSIENIQKLFSEGATEIVSACNSISIALDAPLLSTLSLSEHNFIEMVEPTVSAIKERKERSILLCATNVTIHSGMYQRSFAGLGKQVVTLPMPELVKYIESGKDKEDIKTLLHSYFKTVDLSKHELILLGCTHYPLVLDLFEEVLEELHASVLVYNPSAAVAAEVAIKFNCEGGGKTTLLFSKETEQTKKTQKSLFI